MIRKIGADPASSDLLLLDCQTCRHTFHVRRSVASKVQVCPNCRHSVVPCEKPVPYEKPVLYETVAPCEKEVEPPAVIKAVVRPPVVFVARSVPARPMVDLAGDPVAAIGRLIVGFILGAGAVFGSVLLLPLLVLGFCAVAFLVVALSLVAAYRGPTSSRP
ncbi:MAG TPA: hypothetical protein VND64_23005 [Pirellulales bacterium]|nr:hypothetical protein [Pirellulales bacterium]